MNASLPVPTIFGVDCPFHTRSCPTNQPHQPNPSVQPVQAKSSANPLTKPSIPPHQPNSSTKPSVNPSNQIIRSNLLIHPIHSTRQTIPSAQPVGQPHQTKPSNPARPNQTVGQSLTKPKIHPVNQPHQTKPSNPAPSAQPTVPNMQWYICDTIHGAEPAVSSCKFRACPAYFAPRNPRFLRYCKFCTKTWKRTT